MVNKTRRQALSTNALHVLRAVRDRHLAGGASDDLTPLLAVTNGSYQRLRDALVVLEERWLISWELHGKTIRLRVRGAELLREATYRDRP